MKIFVVRLNPDTRKSPPYTEYPKTKDEYESICRNGSSMNGFHEAVNFRGSAKDDIVRGYLPPQHINSMRDGLFTLVTITAKGAKIGGDKIVGIQARCKYRSNGEAVRKSGSPFSKSLPLTWHYSCKNSMSVLLDLKIPNARRRILGSTGHWIWRPTIEISQSIFNGIIKAAYNTMGVGDIDKIDKLKRIAIFASSGVVA